jgi:hypothetical protein
MPTNSSLSIAKISRQICLTGAVCSSAASTDLCGGRLVTSVPIATLKKQPKNLAHNFLTVFSYFLSWVSSVVGVVGCLRFK